MKKTIFLLTLILIVGCESDDERIPLSMPIPEGEGFCLVEYTQVYFENKSGFIMETGDFPYRINNTLNKHKVWKGDTPIIFHPESELNFCLKMSEIYPECIDVTHTLRLPCSYCVVILNNKTIIDEGTACLDHTMKQVLKTRGELS